MVLYDIVFLYYVHLGVAFYQINDTTLSSRIMCIWVAFHQTFGITKTYDFPGGKDALPHLYLGVSIPHAYGRFMFGFSIADMAC